MQPWLELMAHAGAWQPPAGVALTLTVVLPGGYVQGLLYSCGDGEPACLGYGPLPPCAVWRALDDAARRLRGRTRRRPRPDPVARALGPAAEAFERFVEGLKS